MNTSELKLDLIKRIIDTDHINLLLKISALLNGENYAELEENLSSVNETSLKYENVRVFSAEEQRKINLALEQYKNGECLSDEEAQKEIQEWLED